MTAAKKLPELLTAEDVAERLRVSQRTARRYMQAMDRVELPGGLRVTEESLAAWLRERSKKSWESVSSSADESGTRTFASRLASGSRSPRDARTKSLQKPRVGDSNESLQIRPLQPKRRPPSPAS